MRALEILNAHYNKKKLSGYSMRALARDLKVSPAFVSNILKGKKKLPKQLFHEFCKRLDIDSEEALEIQIRLYPQDTVSQDFLKRTSASSHWKVGPQNAHSALRHWYYVAIMELVTCADFDGSREAVARRLMLSQTVVDIALRELQGIGLIRVENKKITKIEERLRLSSAKSTQEIRSFHRQMLRKAEEQLTDASPEAFEKRLITGITVSTDPKKIQIAKKMLSDALHEIANFLTEEPGTEVFHLAGQLFQITRAK